MRAVTVREIMPQAPVVTAPSHDEVAARAYDLYMERAVEDGSELDDWLRAERELLEERAFVERAQEISFTSTGRRAVRGLREHDLASK